MNSTWSDAPLPRLAIFDLDGTLVEFHHDYLFNQTLLILQRLGREVVARSMLEESFREFDYFRFVEQEEREEFIELFWGLFDWDNFPVPVPLDGAREALGRLAESGTRTAIATARITPEPMLRVLLQDTGLLDYVSCIATRPGDEVPWTDKTGHISEICGRLGVPASQAMMVGDTPTDILSAKAAGIGLTAAVASGGLSRRVLESCEPDYLVKDVSELVETLLADGDRPRAVSLGQID